MAIRTVSEILLTSQEVAAEIGTSRQRVAALAEAGVFEVVSNGNGKLFTKSSVRRYQRTARKPGRPFSERMAFAVLYIISDEPVQWLSPSERCRMRTRMRELDAPALLDLCRNRSGIRRFWCRDNRLGGVADHIRLSAGTGDLSGDFDLTSSDTVEGYVPASAVESVVRSNRLREDFEPHNVILHVPSFLPGGQGSMPVGVCAADLAESSDDRERSAGLRKLEELLSGFRQSGK